MLLVQVLPLVFKSNALLVNSIMYTDVIHGPEIEVSSPIVDVLLPISRECACVNHVQGTNARAAAVTSRVVRSSLISDAARSLTIFPCSFRVPIIDPLHAN